MNTEFSEIDIWFTDQNNNTLEIEDNVNIDKSIDVGKSMTKNMVKKY